MHASGRSWGWYYGLDIRCGLFAFGDSWLGGLSLLLMGGMASQLQSFTF
jgi:hypothetical protein